MKYKRKKNGNNFTILPFACATFVNLFHVLYAYLQTSQKPLFILERLMLQSFSKHMLMEVFSLFANLMSVDANSGNAV